MKVKEGRAFKEYDEILFYSRSTDWRRPGQSAQQAAKHIAYWATHLIHADLEQIGMCLPLLILQGKEVVKMGKRDLISIVPFFINKVPFLHQSVKNSSTSPGLVGR